MESVQMKARNLWLAAAVVLAAIMPVQGQIIAGRSENAEAAVYVDVTTGVATPLFSLTDSGFSGSGVEGLAVDDANRTIYVCSGATVPDRQWILSAHYDDRDFTTPSRIRLRKVVDVLPFIRLAGLAWNSTNSKLYAAYPYTAGGVEGIYEINLTTGAATVVYDFTSIGSSIDVRGLDFNPVDGFLYGTDLATTAPGRSLIRINLVAQTITDINSTLTAVQSGLAIGGNKAYIVPDDDNTPAAPIKVYNLGTSAFEADIANPWTGDKSSAGAGWGPSALNVPAGSNLGTTLTALPTNAVEYAVGTQITYSVKFRNFGPSDATDLPVLYSIVLGGTATATISGGITSDSGTAAQGPAGTITGSLATFVNLATENVTFTVTTTGAGTLTVTSSIPPGLNTDAYLVNNTESYSHGIRVYPATDVVFTTVQSSPRSDVPGASPLKFEYDASSSTQKFRKAYRSPNGDYIGLWADTNAGNTLADEVYMLKNPAGTWAIGAREGTTATTNGDTIGTMILNPAISLNNNGHYAIANDTNASSATDETLIVYDGTNHVAVAREGLTIPPLSPGVYPGTIDSPAIDGMDRATFRVAYLALPVPAAQNQALLADNGNRVLAQKGVTIPLGQAGGGTSAWESFDQDKLFMDCLGLEWLVQGDTLAATTADDVLVVNGTVVLQQGQGVTGLTGTIPEPSTTGGIILAEMYGNGDWYCNGTTTVTTEDFVIKGHGTSYSLIAKWGDLIYTGSSEHWSDVDGFTPGFFAVAGNTQGDYVIVGRTDNVDIKKNVAAVMNGTTELFREGDRVDLNVDGFFEDDAFIDSWAGSSSDPYPALLTDDGDFYAAVNLRSSTVAFIGKAFIKIHATPSAMPIGADVLVTKTVSDNFLDAIGQQTIFTVTVCNRGPDDATNVVLNDPLPAGLDFIFATNGAAETLPGSNIVTATIATLPACSCQTFQITVAAVGVGIQHNTATVTATQADPNTANNTASVDVTVEVQADVSVTKIDNGGAPVGQQYNYTVTVANAGPAPATNVLVRDTLPPEVSFVTASLPFSQNGQVIDVLIASVPVGSPVVYTITVQANVQALVTNNIAIVSLTETDPNLANNVFSLETINGDVVDLAITKVDDGLANLGNNITYTITVTNHGPHSATNTVVTETLPGNITLVSVSVPYTVVSPGVLEISYASIANQGTEQIIIVVTPLVVGTYVNSVAVAADEIDSNDLNNTATTSTRAGNFRQILPICTQISGHPTAVVPGLLDENGLPVFGEFDSLMYTNVSADGSRWTIDASSTLANQSYDSVMMLGSGFVGTVMAQEGKQAAGAPLGTTYLYFDDEAGFNSNNDFAWGAILSTSSTDYTYTNIGGVNALATKSLDPISGLQDKPPNPAGDETIGNSMVSEHLLNDGRVGFAVHMINNVYSTYRPALLYWNSATGNNAFMQNSVTTIGGETIAGFPLSRNFQTTPDGLHYLVIAEVVTSTTDAMVVDGTRVIRNGDVLPGSAITVDDIFEADLGGNGDWIARGDNLASDDWAVRNGVLVAATGLPIFSGSTELWAEIISAVCVNDVGDYLVVGKTNEPDAAFNEVMVLNGTTLIAREGDPVDLDGDGLFDDGIFVGHPTSTAFLAWNDWLANDRKIHFLGNLRSTEGVDRKAAFLVVDASSPAPECETILGDTNDSGGRNGLDIQSFVDCMLAGGTLTHPCKCGDFDNDGDIDSADVTAFVTALVTDP